MISKSLSRITSDVSSNSKRKPAFKAGFCVGTSKLSGEENHPLSKVGFSMRVDGFSPFDGLAFPGRFERPTSSSAGKRSIH